MTEKVIKWRIQNNILNYYYDVHFAELPAFALSRDTKQNQNSTKALWSSFIIVT